MKQIAFKISDFLRLIFGYGIMVCLFAGGSTFLGYALALGIGGETAVLICTFIYKTLFPILIKISTILVLIGLIAMYLKGEKSLTAESDKKKREIKK